MFTHKHMQLDDAQIRTLVQKKN